MKFVNISVLYRGADSDGKIPYYGFKFEDKTNKLYINITKKGGYVLSMYNGRSIGKESLKKAEAINKAEAFLKNKGFLNIKHNYYEVLGVERGANDDAIKKAYRSMAKKYHPDISKKEASLFQKLGEAYQTLQDYLKEH